MFRGLLDTEEINKLKTVVERQEEELRKANEYVRTDGGGFKTRLVMWGQPGRDVTGMISRSEKMAGTMEKVWL